MTKKKRVFRWKALAPLGLFLVFVIVMWMLFLDTIVRRGIEAAGTELVGAKVELDEVDVRLSEGAVTLRGLRVTNPDAPMTNLFEAQEIVAHLRMLPLTEKKLYIDTAAIRGVRFNTPRETSGAVEQPSEASSVIRDRVSGWAGRVSIPDFSLDGLLGSVDVSALSPDSLQTVQLARSVVRAADSSRSAWEQQLRTLDPRPAIDSGKALLQRLEGASITSLGVNGLVSTLRGARTTVDQLTQVQTQVKSLESTVTSGVGALRNSVGQLSVARANDLRSAMAALKIPSLDTPDLSASLFGGFALAKLQPVLYWLGVVEEYIPPGLDPRRRTGPKRTRLAGEDILFPRSGALPTFTLAFGEVSLSLDSGVAAGHYSALVTGLSSAPSLLGQPIRLRAARDSARQGPTSLQLGAVIDQRTPGAADSIDLAVGGISLPELRLPGLGAVLNLGSGSSTLNLSRANGRLEGRWVWRTPNASWTRPASTATGPQARIENLVWGAVSGLRDVEIDVRFSGDASGPGIGIRSNIGTTIAQSLRQQLQQEINAAEQRVRAEVDRLVQQSVTEAQSRLDDVRSSIESQVTEQVGEVDQVKAALEERIRGLTRLLPPGVRFDQ